MVSWLIVRFFLSHFTQSIVQFPPTKFLFMKKSIPKSRQLTLPALVCCLLAQPLLADASTGAAALKLATAVAQPAAIISGRVTDAAGAGLPGVSVLVKGTSTGTSTNAEGMFSVDVPAGSMLAFSYVGYVTQEVVVGAETTVNVTMQEDVQKLNEVVVVGYLSQDRQNVTSAVSSLDVKEAAKTPAPTLVQGLQGRVAGVTVESAGNPGAVPNILIRGVGTLGTNTQPLYVIDGLWTDNIRDLSPSDIESTVILKDASSTAVYGSRGANGVILITTKRGKSGEPQISFNAYKGVEDIYRKYDLTNHSEWADRAAVAYRNAGLDPTLRMPGSVKGTAAYSDSIDTDWQKEFFRTGKVEDYNLTFSGGSSAGKSSTNFLISGGYFRQDGIVKGPSFERYNVRLNSGLTRGRLKISQSALLTHINTTLLNEVPFVDVLAELPGIPVYNAANFGGYGFGSANLFNYSVNPIGAQQILTRTQKNNLLQGNITGEFAITNWLSYRLNMGIDLHDYNDKNARKEGYIRLGESTPNTTYLYENRGTSMFTLVENTLNLNKRFGDHSVNALIGYSQQATSTNNATANATGYTSTPQYFFTLASGSNAATPPTVGGGLDEFTKRSYFSQLNYDYKNRYLITGSFRRDGSSRFDNTRQYGTFGAGSVGWRISEEDFFKSALPMVNSLKLRASYGMNGNDFLPNYAYQPVINPLIFYPLGTGQVLTPAGIQPALPSKDIHWESRYTTDFGLDMALLDSRLSLSADYYISTTKDALISPPLPAYLGTSGYAQPYTNLGEIQNKGFEFALGYHENRSSFTYGADLTLTTLHNEVRKLSELQPVIPGDFGVTRTEVGQPISRLYVLEMLGIFQSQDEIDNYKSADGKVIQPLAQPGDVKYKDENGDGAITYSGDRKYVGNPFPTLQFGLNLTAAYKGFDLSVFWQGVSGNDVLNITRTAVDGLSGDTNFRSDLEPWTPENHSNTTPRLVYGGGNEAVKNYELASTRWIEDGSYLRLKNVQIGYTFPKALTSKISTTSTVRIYLTGRNIFTITKYTGFDPETPGTSLFGRGLDNGTYPNVRTFTGGLQVNF
jgi:TonB-linked SusC/RagA family outer membrane protein